MKRELAAIYQNIRQQERADLEKRIRAAFARLPELARLDEERAQIMRDIGGKKLDAQAGRTAMEDLAKREAALLIAAGLPGDSLQLRYRCTLCKDTGYLDALGKEPCTCQTQHALLLDRDETINGQETFEGFSESIYPDEQQRKRSLKAKAICESYADSLPRPEKPNLLILGNYGLGKSYLSNAIARRAMERGVEAERVTAYAFTQNILEDIKSGTRHAARYQSVPLFVLDDLGSEPVIPNVSNEWLFAVINERLLHGLPTVVVTNLDYETIGRRYGDRLLSRFCDQQSTRQLRLIGKDLRACPC